MAPEHPPTASPPIVSTLDFGRGDAHAGPGGELDGGRLLVHNESADTPSGVPAIADVFRDVIVDARLTLVAGSDTSLYGLYVRQHAGDSYVGWGMSPAGRIVTGLVADNQWYGTTDAAIAPDLPFEPGTGVANRFQILCCGPAIVFILNGAIVTAMSVDQRFKQGQLGFWLLRGTGVDRATMAADWLQVRAVLP